MTENRVHIVAVEYLNTLPFIRGLEALSDQSWFRLIRAHPSDCVRIMKERKADIGLIPVAAIPELGKVEVFSPYCIGANGRVDTVGIISDVPLDETERIYLDYQSRTSVELCKLLIRDFWQLEEIDLVEAQPGYEEEIAGRTAGLLIGDRVFEMRRRKRYYYDLGEAWKEWTGWSFAFALWVMRPGVGKDIRKKVNEAFEIGMQQLAELSEEYRSFFPERIRYFERSISYPFDEEKQKAVALFLEKCGHSSTVRRLLPARQKELNR